MGRRRRRRRRRRSARRRRRRRKRGRRRRRRRRGRGRGRGRRWKELMSKRHGVGLQTLMGRRWRWSEVVVGGGGWRRMEMRVELSCGAHTHTLSQCVEVKTSDGEKVEERERKKTMG